MTHPQQTLTIHHLELQVVQMLPFDWLSESKRI
jgi:hypothetical protein